MIFAVEKSSKMGFFDNIFKGRASSTPSGEGLPIIVSTHGDLGEISPTNAMTIAPVYECVQLIADTIGTLPVHVKRRMADGSRVQDPTHPISRLMSRPSPILGRVDLFRALLSAKELYGNGYAHIAARDRKGYPTRINYLKPTDVTPMVGDDDIYYKVASLGMSIPSRDIIHIKGYSADGIVGESPITLLSDEIENCRNTTRFSKNLYKNDLRTTGVFSTDKTLGEDGLRRLFSDLGKMLKRAKTSGTPIILEEGMKFQAMTLTPEDAQFTTTKLQIIDQVAAIFRVPPHKVGDLTRSTYSNVEQGNLEFYNDCLRPRIVQLEEELNRKLFLEAEQSEYYIEIDFRGMLLTDSNARKEMYKEMFYIGAYSQNEIRALEDLPAIEGGDEHYIPVNMTTSKLMHKSADNE